MDEERFWYEDGLDAEELEFQRRYGPWKRSTPTDALAMLRGYGGEWWLAGGWALEAFTGVRRPHGDVDLSLWRRDIEMLRLHLKDRYHLWSQDSGQLRPLTDEAPEQPATSEQIWLRKHALAPWEFDVIINPERNGRWVFRRDRELDFALADITWLAPDGVRYLNPELVLAYKAKAARAKDEHDLRTTLPFLSDQQRTWLAKMVEHLHPGHPWLERL
ncbi:hypothetical protein HPO96_26875 [Kribbella sandramycini]|uniref:Aminoglycoside-2''-adenylyltransferase n=1 Tax=Kribbella sandramycini TaxID=60450 RepID=A0A7Y4P154_9ACTN|nr:hypothetical protein [Kribbella sandramycini]MBB6570736.1 hypothetical protein [Kribbella sandramycini]NOL43877.1 hypothetical protein [Kribbella sandramycini]